MEVLSQFNSLSMLAIPLFAAGGWMVLWGGREWFRPKRRADQESNRLLVMIKGFRIAIIGLAIFGLGIWLLTDQTWILIVSLGVGGEELLESSFIITAIHSDPRRKASATKRGSARVPIP